MERNEGAMAEGDATTMVLQLRLRCVRCSGKLVTNGRNPRLRGYCR